MADSPTCEVLDCLLLQVYAHTPNRTEGHVLITCECVESKRTYILELAFYPGPSPLKNWKRAWYILSVHVCNIPWFWRFVK